METKLVPLKGNCTPNLKLACFVLYPKIINTFLKNNMHLIVNFDNFKAIMALPQNWCNSTSVLGATTLITSQTEEDGRTTTNVKQSKLTAPSVNKRQRCDIKTRWTGTDEKWFRWHHSSRMCILWWNYDQVSSFRSHKGVLTDKQGGPRPCILPRAMASSAMGLKLRVFGFLTTTHAKKRKTNFSTIFAHVAAFYACVSSGSDRSRCSWHRHLINTVILITGKKPKYSQFEPHAVIKMSQILGSPFYICGYTISYFKSHVFIKCTIK